jgi:hypothetical protein
MKIWEKLEQFPPPLVRCLARQKAMGKAVKALSDQEVAILSNGLNAVEVKEISKSSSWDKIEIGRAKAFCRGCLFDPLSADDRNRAGAYMRSSPTFTFLQNHPHWESTFLPLIKLYKERCQEKEQ